MLRMRTISQAADWLRENDKDTALTKTALRRLVTTGQIPSTRIGQGKRPKYLISLEAIEEYLRDGGAAAQQAAAGGIRRIEL